jgi:hypothetical protein
MQTAARELHVPLVYSLSPSRPHFQQASMLPGACRPTPASARATPRLLDGPLLRLGFDGLAGFNPGLRRVGGIRLAVTGSFTSCGSPGSSLLMRSHRD